MKLPTLYSRTSTGATQIWEIEIVGNKYRSTSGQIDGLKTTTEFTVCEGKNLGRANETSPENQAQKEAEAHWKKKKKVKYFEDINDIDEETYVKPMLAKNFKDRKDKVKYPVIVQNKLNGFRCIATKEGLFTRKGERYFSLIHIEEVLKPIFKNYPDAVIDGEAFNTDYRQQLSKISELCRKTVHVTPDDLKKSRELIQYHIYDGFGFGHNLGQEDPYEKRKQSLDNMIDAIKSPYLKKVESFIAHNEGDITKVFNKFVSQGHEGVMVRIADSPYENKRSSYLLKAKPVDDDEFLIVDVVEGEGNRSGMAGKVIVKMKDGRTFGANVKGCEEQFTELLNNKLDYIGKTATIYYNGFTTYKIPNYAQFDCNAWDTGSK